MRVKKKSTSRCRRNCARSRPCPSSRICNGKGSCHCQLLNQHTTITYCRRRTRHYCTEEHACFLIHASFTHTTTEQNGRKEKMIYSSSIYYSGDPLCLLRIAIESNNNLAVLAFLLPIISRGILRQCSLTLSAMQASVFYCLSIYY